MTAFGPGGWVRAADLAQNPSWAVPELGNGFTRPVGEGPDQPWHHRTLVPPGRYRVSVTLGGWVEPVALTVFFGRRRCVWWKRRFEPGEAATLVRTEFVGPVVPRGSPAPAPVEGIDITVIGGPWIRQVAVEPDPAARVMHIAGDSTVTDQPADRPWDPLKSYCGWGQMLPLFLPQEMGVNNQAHSGLTTESFRSEGHWDLVQSSLQPQDLVLFQFGHNDQKLPHLAAEGGYADNLRRYIAETLARGARPLVVSPVSRNLWNGPEGQFNDLLADWAAAAGGVARTEGVPFVDLHRASVDWILARGQEGARPYFFPGDYTHFNDEGGREIASLVYQGLEAQKAFSVVPGGRMGSSNLGSPPARVVPTEPSGPFSRAEALALVMSAVPILPCPVYNDAFADVFGDEWYAGNVQAAWDRGLLSRGEGRFGPSEPVTDDWWVGLLSQTVRSQGREWEADTGTRGVVPRPRAQEDLSRLRELFGSPRP